ncbi:fungal-specific transcription factor domain-containing protein [Thelonectria olida]|uniref:Fungal-specific transcription factor domain-containing protein n=1 Tax=Thelonectria olida TaxID=1576542 RepID=A0A9P9AUV5_9HYPO|nr:fungal-specific transcription factor domain-containing protein [Thelonectria olida]
MSESSAAAKRRMRRIPEEFRKRNPQSCDRCRKRRCKCVPSQTGTGCVTCLEHNVQCSYTIPRKTRFYGSYDDLSDRYRCLEAIVKGAFPNETIDSVAQLTQLGQRMGYQMPDLSDPNRQAAKMEDLVQQPDAPATVASTVASTASAPEPEISSAKSDEPHASLIKDAAGHEHYIGPSGTLNFLNQLRNLVDANSTSPSRGATKFISDDTTQALEAEGEPIVQQPEDLSPDGTSPGSITSAIARDFTRFPTADMDQVLREFPPEETLEALINSYFKNVHDDFPLFHRATFEDEYELYVVQTRRRPHLARSRQRPLPDWGWIGCLHMMVVFGSIANRNIPNADHASLRSKSATATRALLPQFISKCSLNNVRVLLLLALFLHNNNERNAAWNLVGTATRICFALGLHRSDMASTFRPLEREVRKWVFCTLYSFEQFLSSSLGRPSGLQEADVEVVAPREGFVDGGSADTKLVSWSLKLQAILAKTRLLHGSRNLPNTPTVDEIMTSLDSWKRDISQSPGCNVPWIKSPLTRSNAMSMDELKVSLAWKTRAQLRAVLLLHIQFHYIAIVATRPVLLRDIAMLRKMTGGSVSALATVCVKHAIQVGYLSLLLDYFEVINGLSGLDIFYAYCATMILILRLLRLEGASDELQSCIRHLVSDMRLAINRTEKSGSMKRFARVVDTFSECINNPSEPLPNANPPAQGFQSGTLTTGPGAFDHLQADMSSSMPFAESMDGLLDFLPFNFAEGMPFVGNQDIPMPEWSDMELLLTGYSEPM